MTFPCAAPLASPFLQPGMRKRACLDLESGTACTLTRSSNCCVRALHESSLVLQVLTPDNVKALRESVLTLTKTLQHIEGITGDLGGFTGDARNKSNLKQLIEALSRIVAD